MQLPCQPDPLAAAAARRQDLERLSGSDPQTCRQGPFAAAILAVTLLARLASRVIPWLNPAMKIRLRIVPLLVSLAATAAFPFQDPAPVKRVVEDFLRVQTKGLPGRVSFSVSPMDPGNQLAPCPAPLEAGQPPGTRAWGKTTVTVRCPIDGGWSVFVPVQVRIVAEYLVAARPLAQRQVLTDADLGRQSGDLSDLPAGTLTDPAQAVGRQTALAVAAGQPLRSDMLRQVLVVLQNQAVKVVSKGQGFQVANEGRALNNGVEGQVVQVRLGNGQVVSGIARNGGIVEVSY
jgi:flagella basal body P-ring formation protein FlgA